MIRKGAARPRTGNGIDTHGLFIEAARVLRSRFLQQKHIPHATSKGTERELLVREFLNDHLPRRYGAHSGFIVDRARNVSPQVDVVIYDALSSPTYYRSQNALILDRDVARIAIEVKSRLTKRDLLKAMADASRVKSLVQGINSLDSISLATGKKVIDDTVAGYGREIMYTIFAFESALSLEEISRLWIENYCNYGLGLQIDSITIFDKGFVNLAGWHPNADLPARGLIPIPCAPPLRIHGQTPQSRPIYPTLDRSTGKVSIRVGGPTFFAPGSKFYIAYSEVKELALDAFFRMIVNYLAALDMFEKGQIPFLSSLTEYQEVDSQRPRVQPLAICSAINPTSLEFADQERLAEDVRELFS